MQNWPINDNFPDGFYEEYARIVIAVGRIEYLVKLCIKSLSGLGFTKGMAEAENKRQLSALLAYATSLADTDRLSASQSHAFVQLIEETQPWTNERNDNVHAYWTADSAGLARRARIERDKESGTIDSRKSGVIRLSVLRSQHLKLESLALRFEEIRSNWPTDK